MIRNELHFTCDRCNTKLNFVFVNKTATLARREYELHGWRHSRAKDYCANCVKELNARNLNGSVLGSKYPARPPKL